MQVTSKPVSPSVHKDKHLPVALFKTSLRDWQARYRARRVTQARVVLSIEVTLLRDCHPSIELLPSPLAGPRGRGCPRDEGG